MSTYSAVFKGAAGTNLLPFAGIRSGSTGHIIVREIKVFNQGSLSAIIRVARITTVGTSTGLTAKEHNEGGPPPLGTAVHTYTSTGPTIEAGDVDIGMVGAAVGSGFHYTYYGEGRGLYIPLAASSAVGIVLVEDVDTANTYSGAFVWEE